jgi:ADP-ribose pyrophosphatase
MANQIKPQTKAAGKPSAKSSTRPAPRTTGKAVVLKSKLSFRGKVFSVTTDTVTEPGGVTSTRDVIQHNGSVIILAVDASADPANPTILLERQYRHAAGQFLLELPAGRIEPNEAPLAAAKRELIEETGFRARRWSRLVRYYASPGFLAETMQVFLAEEISAGIAQPEPDEKITLLQTPLSEVLTMIEQGKILDGKTILSVLLFERRRKIK